MIRRCAIGIQDKNGLKKRASIGNSVMLGYHSQCDAVLSDEMLSRKHLFKAEDKGTRYWAEDLCSLPTMGVSLHD
ncbi:MAG: FHA domain-containing protein [Holophagales bacterium]|jgi:hypothetical protein|nr:FHA domain-containing protein [Holophagales bacterium]